MRPHRPDCASLTGPIKIVRDRLLVSRSRWAGYLKSLPNDQNWHGIALFWDAALRDPLSCHDISGDGRQAEPAGLDPDGGDAAEARRWLLGTEAETHFLLPGPPRTPVLVCPFCWSRARNKHPRVEGMTHAFSRTPRCDMSHRMKFRVSTFPWRRRFLSVLVYPHPRKDSGMLMRSSVPVHSWLTHITVWPWCL